MQRWYLLGTVLVIACNADPSSELDGGLIVEGKKKFDAAIDAPPIDAPPIDAGPCTVNMWCLDGSPVSTKLNGVFALSSDDVFAVGDGGVILRRTGGTWSVMTSGTTNNLRGVWAASASEAWAVGASGTILKWNGSTWSPAGGPTTTTTYEAVWGSSATDVWAVGGTRVDRYTGSGWTTYGRSATVLLDVSGTGPNDVWITGEGAYIQRWNGTAWSTNTMNGIGSDLFAVHALSTANVWVTSGVPSKQTANWTGSTWTPYTTTANAMSSLWGSGATDLWGVSGVKIAHWTGTWAVETPATITQNLRAVSGSGTYVWVVGDGGTIAHRHP